MTRFFAQVTTTFGTFHLDAELNAYAGSVTGVFGASGSGKTSLLRCMAGLTRPTRGKVTLGDEVWQDADRFVPVHQRGIGFVTQHDDLLPHLSVGENLRYARDRAPQNPPISMNDVAEQMGITSLLSRGTTDLSGGERQRVAIARSVVSAPRILFLDEPVSALDDPSRRRVLRHLERILQDLPIPVVYVTHSLTEIVRLADTVVWLKAGRVGDSGPTGKVLSRPDFAGWLDREPTAVLSATIARHDEEFHLTVVSTPFGELIIQPRPESPGQKIKLQINARDVSVGLQAQIESSIVNEVAVKIDEVVDLSKSECLLRLKPLADDLDVVVAKITQKSRVQLGLAPGMTVFARVKGVAVLD